MARFEKISRRSLGSERLEPIEIRAGMVSHARRTVFRMAEVAVPGELSAEVLDRIRSTAEAPT